MINTIIFGVVYSFVFYYMSGQLLEKERLIGYILLMVLAFLISEALGHSIGIILKNYPELSILAGIGIEGQMMLVSSFYFPESKLSRPLLIYSEFCFPKHVFNSALILIYGMNRCSAHEKSVVLLKFELHEEDLVPNFQKLLIYLIFLRLLTFVILYLKTETRISLKMFTKKSTKTDDSFEMKSNKNKGQQKFFDRRMSMAVTQINMNSLGYLAQLESENNNIENNNQKLLSAIAWTDLTLCVPKTLFKEQKVILKQINGVLEFGTINGLMGPSGAGKTTLLNSINGLYPNYLTNESTILLSKFRTIQTCFITQNQKDHIMTGLTARQAVTYASKLKNSDKDFKHYKNVENIMNELMISNTFDTNVENCSGGEQKRLVIAMEMTSTVKPNLLCIDEPTSGLDSNAAEVVGPSIIKHLFKHFIFNFNSLFR